MKKLSSMILILSMMLIIGCKRVKPELDIVQQSSWLVYWDDERGIEELQNIPDLFQELSIFALDFNEKGEFRNQQAVSNMIAQVEETQNTMHLFVTIVNDVVTEKQSIQKDQNILQTILIDHPEKYITEIVQKCVELGVSGIELDFERIPREMMPEYLSFIEQLSTELNKKNKMLKVVLEPSLVTDAYQYPSIARYIIMAYNLYGTHSEPGPKANTEFLNDLCETAKNLPGDVAIALATGGFQWSDSKVRGITELEGKQMISSFALQPHRDELSQALSASFQDSLGEVSIWYGDAQTMQYWKSIVVSYGYDVAYFRLGGNDIKTLQSLK